MKIKIPEIIGTSIGIIIIALAVSVFLEAKFFLLLIGLGIISIILPFVIRILEENRDQKEKEEMFIEFTRNLVESVKTGTPVSKSIINIKNKDYGVLGPHINKLANQISLGIPLSQAFQTFSKDIGNKTVSRALTLIGQAERAGGEIGEILEAVAGAVTTSDKLKKERVSAISSLVVQGYIIFLVFIIIVLVMQFNILPQIAQLPTGTSQLPAEIVGLNQNVDQNSIGNAFFYLLLVQGFFSGLTIGKLSEGSIKAGIKHSFALIMLSFVIYATASIFF